MTTTTLVTDARTVFVYTLSHQDGIYIGKSFSPKSRLRDHRRITVNGPDDHVKYRVLHAWMNEVGIENIKLTVTCGFDTDAEACVVEAEQVAVFRALGFRVLNVFKGGQPRAPETIAKISAGNTGKSPTPEARAKSSAAMSGRSQTEAHRAAVSKALTGGKATEEARASLRAGWVKRKARGL